MDDPSHLLLIVAASLILPVHAVEEHTLSHPNINLLLRQEEPHPSEPLPESTATRISRPNIDLRYNEHAFNVYQVISSTSSFDWWPYPAWGASTSSVTAPSTTQEPPALVFSLSSPSSSRAASAAEDLAVSSSAATTSIIQLTALPPGANPAFATSAVRSPYNSESNRPPVSAIAYLVPICVIAGLIVGAAIAWIGYGIWLRRRTHHGSGISKASGGSSSFTSKTSTRRRRARRFTAAGDDLEDEDVVGGGSWFKRSKAANKSRARSRNENGRPRKSGGTLLEAGTRYENLPPPLSPHLDDDEEGEYRRGSGAVQVEAPLLSPITHHSDLSSIAPSRSNTISTTTFSISTTGAHGTGKYDTLRAKTYREGLLERINAPSFSGDNNMRRRVSHGRRDGSGDGGETPMRSLTVSSAYTATTATTARTRGDRDRDADAKSFMTSTTGPGFRMIEEDPDEVEVDLGDASSARSNSGSSSSSGSSGVGGDRGRAGAGLGVAPGPGPGWGWEGLDVRANPLALPPPCVSGSGTSHDHIRARLEISDDDDGDDEDENDDDDKHRGVSQYNPGSIIISKAGQWAPASSGWWDTIRSAVLRVGDGDGDGEGDGEDRYTALPEPGSRSRASLHSNHTKSSGTTVTMGGGGGGGGGGGMGSMPASPTMSPKRAARYQRAQRSAPGSPISTPPRSPISPGGTNEPRRRQTIASPSLNSTRTHPPPPSHSASASGGGAPRAANLPPRNMTSRDRDTTTRKRDIVDHTGILPVSPRQITSPRLESQILFTPAMSMSMSCLDLQKLGGDSDAEEGGAGGTAKASTSAPRGPRAAGNKQDSNGTSSSAASKVRAGRGKTKGNVLRSPTPRYAKLPFPDKTPEAKEVYRGRLVKPQRGEVLDTAG